MLGKKRTKILAAVLCASTMAAFYGGPKAEALSGDVSYDGTNFYVDGLLGLTQSEITSVTIGSTIIDSAGLEVRTGTTDTTVNGGGFSVVGINAQAGNSMTFNAANGMATFTSAAGSTTIAGNTITTGILKTDTLQLGTGAVTHNITITPEGSASFANGHFTVAADGSLKTTDNLGNTTFTVDAVSGALTANSGTFGTDSNNQTIINSGTYNSTATDGANKNITVSNAFGQKLTVTDTNQSYDENITAAGSTVAVAKSGLTFTEEITADNVVRSMGNGTEKVTEAMTIAGTVTTVNGATTTTVTTAADSFKVAGAAAAFDFNTATGVGTFTGTDATTTTVSGSELTSTNEGTTGVLKGSDLTLTDGTNVTALTAGGAAFTGTAGNSTKAGTTTTIDGGIITTDTLKVERIELGETMVNADGTTTTGSNLTISADGSLSAAGGNFTVSKDGAVSNKIGDTSFTTSSSGITSAVGSAVKTEMTEDGVKTTVGTTTQTVSADSVTTKVGDYTSTLANDGMGVTNGTGNTKITSGDVSITTDDYDIKLSEMGQVGDIDSELQGRSEYDGTVVSGLNAEAGIRREEVARLDNRIDRTEERLDRVGAMAAAAASLKSMGYDPAAPSEFAIGLGTYKGAQAVAVGLFHYPNRDFMLNVSYTQSGSEKMGGVGATWKFGRKNPDKVLDAQLKERQNKVQIAKEKAEAAQKVAQEAQKRAEYAAKQAELAKTEAATAAKSVEQAYANR